MKNKDFNKLLKEKKPKNGNLINQYDSQIKADEIISDYMICKIFLTDKQLDKVCSLGSHHGGCGFGKVVKQYGIK